MPPSPGRKKKPTVAEQRAAAATLREQQPKMGARYARALDELYPWDRLSIEGDEQWGLFRDWRDSPRPRPTYRAYAAVCISPRTGRPRAPATIMGAAAKYRWPERAVAYDRWLDRIDVETVMESRRRQAQAAQQVGDLALAIAGTELRSMLDRVTRAHRDGVGPVYDPLDLERMARAFIPLSYRGRELQEPRIYTGASQAEQPGIDTGYGPPADLAAIDPESLAGTAISTAGRAPAMMADPAIRAAILAFNAAESDRRTGPIIDTTTSATGLPAGPVLDARAHAATVFDDDGPDPGDDDDDTDDVDISMGDGT